MIIKETHIVPENTENFRLSDYAHKIFKSVTTRSAVKKAIKKNRILVNCDVATTALRVIPGQIIELIEDINDNRKIYEFVLDVVYEDEYIAIINKPGGISTSGNQFKTVEHSLAYNLKKSSEPDALNNALPTHRLDSATSGLLMCAKTSKARIIIGAQFENKLINKKYQAVVIGKTPLNGKIETPINGKLALTTFKTLKTAPSNKYKHLSLIELQPATGRTHQLRIHTAELGFQILGDKLYGNAEQILRGKGLFLCAVELNFEHPVSGVKQQIKIETPPKFNKFMDRQHKRFEIKNK